GAVHGDVLAVWRDYASNASGGPIDCGHYVPEEAPDAVFEAFMRHFKGGRSLVGFLATDEQGCTRIVSPMMQAGPPSEASVSGAVDRALCGIAAAVGFVEGVASCRGAGAAIDAAIGHLGGPAGTLADVIGPERRAGRAGDRHGRATIG